MNVQAIQAIDVHAHYGRMIRGREPFDGWLSGDEKVVARRARAANVEWTIVSPLESLMPRGYADAFRGNESAAKAVADTDGLLQWVVVNPLQPSTYAQAERMLKDSKKCVGIKIHPEEHLYPIKKHGRALFEFFAQQRAIVLTHSGEGNSWPEDFIPFADDFPEVKLILAHIGCSADIDMTHQVRAVQMSKRGNVYTDTSSQQSTLTGIIEWAVRELGPERILFGTDTPLYSTGSQRARIDHAEMSDAAKQLILRDNAVKLFNLH